MGNRVVGRSGTAAAAEDAATRRLRAEERLATGKAVAGKGAGNLGGRRNDGDAWGSTSRNPIEGAANRRGRTSRNPEEGGSQRSICHGKGGEKQ